MKNRKRYFFSPFFNDSNYIFSFILSKQHELINTHFKAVEQNQLAIYQVQSTIHLFQLHQR